MSCCQASLAAVVARFPIPSGRYSIQNLIQVKGASAWRFREKDPNPYQQEHLDLINSIRAGQPLNEARAVAESTLVGIMGRETVYSGKTVEWETALNSTTRLGPEQYEFGEMAFPEIALPGRHQFS